MSESYFYSCDVYRDRLLKQRAPQTVAALESSLQNLKKQQCAWAAKSSKSRAIAVLALAERLSNARHRLAELIALEVGRCLNECYAEIDKTIALIRYYAACAPELLAAKSISTSATISRVQFEPLGVILVVMPWNYPVWQILRCAIPAICAGNACLVKPAPGVLQVSEALFALIDETQLPIAPAFAAHQDLETLLQQCQALAFTGSAHTGRHLAALAGKHLKKCVLELGGSNAFIVLEDADIESAATDACYARFRDAGQSCNAAKRMIPVAKIADEFVAALLRHSHKLRHGDPFDPKTTLASLHQPSAAATLQAQIDDTLAQGAKCLMGGQLSTQTHYYPATVIDHVPSKSRLAQEEVFGPVAAILRARDPADAIRLANDSPYGLGASIYTANIELAQSLARELHTGSVYINRHTSSDLHLPFGGVKDSGFGRELSEFGLYEFVNVKSYWQK